MKGDFSRITFDPRKQYTRVLMQQGRVQLDADWNEQVAIFWHYWRALTQDLVGPHGGPANALGFEIEANGDEDFTIGPGRYYVGGLLCENWPGDNNNISYYDQRENYPLDKEKDELPDLPFLVYLDVWERHLTYVEDGYIREVALGGPDTTTRSQVVWQVKAWELTDDRLEELQERLGVDPLQLEQLCQVLNDTWETVAGYWWPESSGRLRAQTERQVKSTDPCITAPESRYRGAENQLYRVEIHEGGGANTATYKWSRDNGAITFPIHMASGNIISLATMGWDNGRTLNDGNIVEVVDNPYSLRLEQAARPLLKVAHVDRVEMQVTLTSLNGNGALPDLPTYSKNDVRYPLLRRWDGYGTVSEGSWLTLEDGIQIQFVPAETGEDAPDYTRGDYWLIPARVATGDIEWPGPATNPEARPPHGVRHYFAPLAIVRAFDNNGVDDCRYQFAPIAEPVPASS